MRDDLIHAAGNAYKVQTDQTRRVQNVLGEASEAIDELLASQASMSNELDDLLAQAEALAADTDLSFDDTDALPEQEDILAQAEALVELTEEEKQQIPHRLFEQVQTIDANGSWEDYLNHVQLYADEFNIDLTNDPFEDLLTVYDREQITERINRDCTEKNAHCDKIDYGFAALSGVLSALVDIFIVKSPSDNNNLKKVDDFTDHAVLKASKMIWNSDQKKREGIQAKFQNKQISREERDRLLGKYDIPTDCCLTIGPESLQNGILYLEKRFKVVYDSVRKNDLKNVPGNHMADMNPVNHHIKSLAHSPDIIGWLFSVVDQFTETASFIDGNRVLHLEKRNTGTGSFKLHGNTIPAKLLAGTINWVGHLLSDMAGSTSTKDGNRGMGVCAPFMELLQLCPLSVKDTSSDKPEMVKISDLAEKLFSEGYDFRFSCLQALPVAINECFIRLFWAIRQMLQYQKSTGEIIKMMNPVKPNPELQRMLLVGHGTLCILESGEATVAHLGNPVEIALHINMVAWVRFAWLGYREIHSIYARKERNIARMDQDIQEEWERLMRG